MNANVSTMRLEAAPGPAEAGNSLSGRFMLPDQSERKCRVQNMTPDNADIISDADVSEGDHIVAYIDEIGRVEGDVSAVFNGGFKLVFRLTSLRRERIFKRLEWLRDKAAGRASEQRRHERYQPKDSKSVITLSDGRSYPCEVLDISLSGASIKTQVLPAIGTHVMLGKMQGRVVRYHEQGLGIEFVRPMDQNTLHSRIKPI